jgi:hypothetical protein
MKQQELLTDCYGYQPVESQEWMGIWIEFGAPTSITGVVGQTGDSHNSYKRSYTKNLSQEWYVSDRSSDSSNVADQNR